MDKDIGYFILFLQLIFFFSHINPLFTNSPMQTFSIQRKKNKQTKNHEIELARARCATNKFHSKNIFISFLHSNKLISIHLRYLLIFHLHFSPFTVIHISHTKNIFERKTSIAIFGLWEKPLSILFPKFVWPLAKSSKTIFYSKC